MPKPDWILSFSTDADGDQVFIHADAAGLDHLIQSLTRIRRKLDDDICDHDHLMTDAWGGRELSEATLDEGARLVHHVKIYAWTPEWIEKHHLKT
jgi:Immunity protein 32